MREITVYNIINAVRVLDPVDPEIIRGLVTENFMTEFKEIPTTPDEKSIFIGKVYGFLAEHGQTDKMPAFLSALDNPITDKSVRKAVETLGPIDPEIIRVLLTSSFWWKLAGQITDLQEEYLLIGKVWEVLLEYKQTDKMDIFLAALTEGTEEE